MVCLRRGDGTPSSEGLSKTEMDCARTSTSESHCFSCGSVKEDDARNELEQKDFEERNGKIYTLTNPPVERATQGRLESYFVRKVGPFYLAEHHGGG